MSRSGRSGGGAQGGAGRRKRRQTDSGRTLKVRVKTAKQRSTSSTRWLQRQLNDPYVAEAKRRGYRSRAAFKLLQLNERFPLLFPGAAVVDLGAAPGGWSQVAAERCQPGGRVIAFDLQEIEAIPGVETMIGDFLAVDAPARIKAALKSPADLVMSDMAAPSTGHGKTDHLRIMALAEAAYELAREILRPGGSFVVKVLQGGTEQALLQLLRRDFAKLRHVKPAASRSDSSELYLVATGFRGGQR